MATITAQLLATLMHANCEAYLCERIGRDEWSAAQNRLWRLAGEKGVASEVLRLVCPSPGAAQREAVGR